MVERQTFVTWYTPEEKLPKEDTVVLITVSGRSGKLCTYDHAFALAEWNGADNGWFLWSCDLDDFTVHAWCDIEPYRG